MLAMIIMAKRYRSKTHKVNKVMKKRYRTRNRKPSSKNIFKTRVFSSFLGKKFKISF